MGEVAGEVEGDGDSDSEAEGDGVADVDSEAEQRHGRAPCGGGGSTYQTVSHTSTEMQIKPAQVLQGRHIPEPDSDGDGAAKTKREAESRHSGNYQEENNARKRAWRRSWSEKIPAWFSAN